jgi:16S rRNA (guanine527-N7)-methyltransferase
MSPTEAAAITAGATRLGLHLAPDALARLARFLDLLGVWNERIRLIGPRDRETIIGRHVLDGLAPAPHLPGAGRLVDVGSGAGFPGIVLGCTRPDLPLTLVESRRRRASFLREAIRTIPLPQAEVLETRAEALPFSDAAAVTARGLRLDAFLELAAPLLAAEGVAIAMQAVSAIRGAEPAAARYGLRLVAAPTYHLPTGVPRCLLIFAPERVS